MMLGDWIHNNVSFTSVERIAGEIKTYTNGLSDINNITFNLT
ncbi:hypothetical protein SAMN05421760_10455 [Neptunomonas antarctica]|uniref:Uncharacterized protein n=1 Tax=Neptunomonas antarctica TaxID=619304 RepID=A0A1N7LID0_9GAMM|nr:hypothetical protein SAMN05421760_10455 [Neptunomonas antarctica]